MPDKMIQSGLSDKAKALWLPASLYPDRQKAWVLEPPAGEKIPPYTVAEFARTIILPREAVRIEILASGDTTFRLSLNEQFLGCGPVCAGGDFLTVKPLSWRFTSRFSTEVAGRELRFSALVTLGRQRLTDFTQGQGMFLLNCRVFYRDGGSDLFSTDESWGTRLRRDFVSPDIYNGSVESGDFLTPDIVECGVLYDTELPQLTLNTVPTPKETVWKNGCKKIELDKIYSAYPVFSTTKDCSFTASYFEIPGKQSGKQKFTLKAGQKTLPLVFFSIGECLITPEEGNGFPDVQFVSSTYPIDHANEGNLEENTGRWAAVFKTAKHTLSICRQTMHLDSPLHQELLACTGDYYIEMLMEVFCFGDLGLSRMDILRTALWLEQNDGRMFHTTYSLIWVQMLRKYVLITGDHSILPQVRQALSLLFARFSGYENKDGILETPPDYMFVDWVVLEGYSMHHPPQSLGQTVLNAFYYKALTDGTAIAKEEGWDEGKIWQNKAESFPASFHKAFFDEEQQLYLDGLPDTNHRPPTQWLPADPGLRHFSRYPQILSVLYDLCPTNIRKRLIQAGLSEDSGLPEIQPYFTHFSLELIAKEDLRAKFASQFLDKWVPLVEECDKGLKEGWMAPEENYAFDYSHAWGGTPAVFLPQMLLGLEWEAPGFRKISLSPNLLGLTHVKIRVPTPFGPLDVSLEEGKEPMILAPEEVEISFRK